MLNDFYAPRQLPSARVDPQRRHQRQRLDQQRKRPTLLRVQFILCSQRRRRRARHPARRIHENRLSGALVELHLIPLVLEQSIRDAAEFAQNQQRAVARRERVRVRALHRCPRRAVALDRLHGPQQRHDAPRRAQRERPSGAVTLVADAQLEQ